MARCIRPQVRLSAPHTPTPRETPHPNTFFAGSNALLTTALFSLLAATTALVSGCDDKNPFGLATCGDGVCHSSDPYVCPQDCGGIQITTGGEHTCTVKMSDGTVWCWGLNSYGQLGDGTLESASTPRSVTFGESVDAVFAGDDHTCALLNQERKVRCWGKKRFRAARQRLHHRQRHPGGRGGARQCLTPLGGRRPHLRPER